MEPSRSVEPIRTQHLSGEVKGHWVAFRNGEVVEVGSSFDEVMLNLHRRDITNVTVMRIPAEAEAELVGLG